MDAALIGPGARWREVLGQVRHDVYHLPEYVSFAARHEGGGEVAAFIAGEGRHALLVPMILRRVPEVLVPGRHGGDAVWDATSPRGYAGPLLSADHEGAFASEAFAALREVLRQASIVCLFSRLHPFLTLPEALLQPGVLVEHGHAIAVDLTAPSSEWTGRMRDNHRRDIRRAIRGGYVARIDDQWDRLDEFVAIYAATMQRLNAPDAWRLPAEYFHDLRQTLGDRVHLCVVERGGELAAGTLLTEAGGIVEYHLAGTAAEHIDASPSKLAIDFARAWAAERGNLVLHLAGSLAPHDSLSHFKRGFASSAHPVRSWRIVLDAPRYDQLVDAWKVMAGVEADAPEGYFPAYRKPVGGAV